jgi:fructokinase
MSVVAAGEALIDLAPRGDQLLPLPGGSPYNVAVGLARLGTAASYLGQLSTDGFGDRLKGRLTAEGVGLTTAAATSEPTTLAVVHLDAEARASYAFYLDGTSAASLPSPLPPLPADATLHVSLGAIGLEHPAGRGLADLLRASAGERVRTFDPNVRPSAITDQARYAGQMDDLVATCDLVKVSDEDLATLYPDDDPLRTAERWARSGPAAVVVTRGPEGAVAFTDAGHHLDVPGIDVEVVDTVGAGDAFTSGLLAWLDRRGCLVARTDLAAACAGDDLRGAVAYAVRVAALTCTRPGGDPPTHGEVERTFG